MFDFMTKKIAKKFDIPTINIKDLQSALKKNDNKIILLDAREKKEHNISKIPGSIYVGYDDFKMSEVEKSITKDATLVVYCSVGYRSGKIAEKLKSKGYTVKNLRGGIFDWANNKLPVVNQENKPTKKVHGYNRLWSKWLKSFIEVEL